MKALIAIFILLVAVFLFTELVGFYNRTARPRPAYEESNPAPQALAGGESLPGLPPALEASLAQAQQQGVEELGKWLRTWHRQIQDPRLAWIELDYVVLLNLKDHKAAREKFLEVRERTPPSSPVYVRLEKLAPAYEQ